MERFAFDCVCWAVLLEVLLHISGGN